MFRIDIYISIHLDTMGSINFDTNSLGDCMTQFCSLRLEKTFTGTSKKAALQSLKELQKSLFNSLLRGG